MRILIARSGSGWGGVISRYLIDTAERVMINLFECFTLTKDDKYFSDDVLNFKLSDFPKQAYSKYVSNIDLLLLESFLGKCKLHEEPCTMMDHQIDRVYILDANGDMRCVYDTDWGIWPENPALCTKLEKMIELCT